MADLPLTQAHASLLDTVRRFGSQTDDQTLLLMRRLTAPPQEESSSGWFAWQDQELKFWNCG